MNNRSRTYYVYKNGLFGIVNNFLALVLAFISRTVFIKTLGAEYLGINGLYSNILSVLSLAELGIGNVLIFSLYKPIAEKDHLTIARLMSFYKRLYRFIAIGVFALGIIIVPFLGHIVNSSLNDREVLLYYIFFLMNSVFSYLAVYKSTLIKANQEQYIVDTLTTVIKFSVSIMQILVLLLTNSFIAYLVIMVVGTVMQNVLITNYANKKYLFLKDDVGVLQEQKKVIVDNVKSSFIYKVGQVIINYTDSILISVILGTIYVGYYANYSLIVYQIVGIIGILNTSLIASIGNLTTENNPKKTLRVFHELLLFYHVLTAFCSICFILVLNDFIKIWIGVDNLLNQETVIAITFSFYIQNIINPVWMYREAYGLFKQIKYLMLVTALVNIILSVSLGLKFGLAGIIGATGLARLVTTVWYEPKVLYKQIFNVKPTGYYLVQIKYFCCTLISFAAVWVITKNLEPSVFGITLKIVLSLLSVGLVFSIFNFYTNSYKFWLSKSITIIKRK